MVFLSCLALLHSLSLLFSPSTLPSCYFPHYSNKSLAYLIYKNKNKLRRGNFINLIKIVYENPYGKYNELLRAPFTFVQRLQISPALFWRASYHKVRKKRDTRLKTKQQKAKWTLFTKDMTVCMENPG